MVGPRSACLAAALTASALGCGEVPVWRLGDALGTCADASDIACQPFGTPTLVAEVRSSMGDEDDKPTLTQDMLQMYFLSNRDGGLGHGDVWMTTRANVSDPWSTPTVVAALNSSSKEESPAISEDGTTLWVASDRSGGAGGLDIWASVVGTDGTWSSPSPVSQLNSSGDEFPRPPGSHGLVMPLSQRRNSSIPYQIFFSSRSSASSASWSSPVSVPSIDIANLDDDGFLTDDGTTLYFSSDRLNGTQDLFVTQRPTADGDFGPAVPLGGLNTSTAAERDPWVSPDGHEIYFTSDRSGVLQIYHATR
jgi:Tol biopolymer transport system component